ncbi:MAG TPA: glycosyltransferase family 4 protein [Alphaproteobacteria bacterium]
MSRIVLADDGIPFDGRSPEAGPLGGAESAFVSLAEALARRGHAVEAYTKCAATVTHNGVAWRPIDGGAPDAADLYIANRGDKLLTLVPGARSTAFWIHNPARYLRKWRYLSKLWRRQPTLVFLSAYHAGTYPGWAPGRRRAIIPHGIHDAFRDIASPVLPPRPRAVFTSNPLRSLDWLIETWVTRIFPAVPKAELHVFSGPATYGALGARKAGEMEPVLRQARAMKDAGVVLREPLPRDRLAAELAGFRVFAYRGSEEETFCLAAGEAQAAGVPAVVCDIGALAERVRDRETGFVVSPEPGRDERDFATAMIKVLTDDTLWRRLHQGAVSRQRRRGWDDAAVDFERLIES